MRENAAARKRDDSFRKWGIPLHRSLLPECFMGNCRVVGFKKSGSLRNIVNRRKGLGLVYT